LCFTTFVIGKEHIDKALDILDGLCFANFNVEKHATSDLYDGLDYL